MEAAGHGQAHWQASGVLARTAAELDAALAIADVMKDAACTLVAAAADALVSPASGVTSEFVPIPGILMAVDIVDMDIMTGALVAEPAVTTTVLGDDTTTTETVAEGVAFAVVDVP